MGRPKKQTVDYFSHFVKDAETDRVLYILESSFFNSGYAFYYRLRELLCVSQGHYYNCSESADWIYFTAKMKVSPEDAQAMLNLLVQLGEIDRELWEKQKIIWWQELVDSLSHLYKDAATLLDVTLDDDTGGLKNYEYDVSRIEKTDVVIINLLFPESYTSQINIRDQSDNALATEIANNIRGMVIGIKVLNGRYMHSCAQGANTAARYDASLSLFYGQLSGASGFERPKAQNAVTKIKFNLIHPFVSGTRIRIFRW